MILPNLIVQIQKLSSKRLPWVSPITINFKYKNNSKISPQSLFIEANFQKVTLIKLTGTPYAKKEQKEKEEEEDTVFDDSLFEEFSRDFLGKPEQRRNGRQYRK